MGDSVRISQHSAVNWKNLDDLDAKPKWPTDRRQGRQTESVGFTRSASPTSDNNGQCLSKWMPTSRGTATMPLRLAVIPDNYWLITDYHKNQTFPLMKCIGRYVLNGPLIILILVWRKSTHFWRTYAQKTIFLHFRSQCLWSLTFRA